MRRRDTQVISKFPGPGWSDGSVDTSFGGSSEGLAFNSQDRNGGSQLSVVLISGGSDTLIQAHMQAKPMYVKIKNIY